MSNGLRAIFRFRGRRTRRREIRSRRRFLLQSALLFGASAALAARWLLPFRAQGGLREGIAAWRTGGLIRPPTASADDLAFQQACIRCGLCGTVCKSGCIRYFGFSEPDHGVFTPYIDVRDRSCVLCMRCTQVCPTGALSPVEDDVALLPDLIDMGTAEVDPDRCLSYQGRICGYCYDACPLPDVAIKLVPKAKPVVLEDGCVGCGRCVELCPQSPTAIDVRRRA